jgi:uncharacterized membrane protein
MVRVPEELIGLIAVLTLPLGILAFLTLGLQAALVVFVVGWLALVPGLGVLRGWLGEEHPAEAAGAGTEPGTGSTAETDPLETLRERYARGEIDEREFERRLEDLIGTEDGPERPGTGTGTGTGTGGEREPELDLE